MSKKIASVGNSAASSGRAAENAWIRDSIRPTDARRRGIGVTVAQRLLPQHVARGLEVAHHQHAEARVLAEDLGGAAGGRPLRHLHPARLVEVARYRRAPVGGDAQLRQGPLGTDRAARGVYPPDVGRHAARQRPAGERLRAGQSELAQGLGEFLGDRAVARPRLSHGQPTRRASPAHAGPGWSGSRCRARARAGRRSR